MKRKQEPEQQTKAKRSSRSRRQGLVKPEQGIVKLESKLQKLLNLPESRHSFTRTEAVLLERVIGEIKSSDEKFKRYRVQVDSDPAAACRSLGSMLMKVDTPTGWFMSHFFSHVEYTSGRSYVDFYIAPVLKPYLLQLKEGLTQSDLRAVFEGKSKYSVRLLKILRKYEKQEEVIIDIPTLRKQLGIEGEEEPVRNKRGKLIAKSGAYTQFGMFKTRVLDKVQKELQGTSDIGFEYRFIRKGRKVSAIHFKIKKNPRALGEGTDQPQEQPPKTRVSASEPPKKEGDLDIIWEW